MPKFIPKYLGESTPDITLSGTDGADLNVGNGGTLGSAAFYDSNVFVAAETAWLTYSPTVASFAGTIATLGTVTGRYQQIGKTVFIQISIGIITNGTGSDYITSTLPTNAKSGFSFPMTGIEDNTAGYTLIANIAHTDNTKIRIFKASDVSYPGVNGCLLEVNGSYEAN